MRPISKFRVRIDSLVIDSLVEVAGAVNPFRNGIDGIVRSCGLCRSVLVGKLC